MLGKIASSLALFSAPLDKTHMLGTVTSSLELYLARSEKRICQVRLSKNLHSIQHAQKTHMSSKTDFSSHTLFSTHRKRTY